jgi:hypothetical protein
MKAHCWLVVMVVVAAMVAGCSQVPNMDAGSAGCQNAREIGVQSDDAPEVMAEVRGLSPADAARRLNSEGHTVVFNTGGDCWCVPPPGGRLTMAWFGQHGALWLWVDGVDPALTAGEPPFLGYGC